MIQSLCSGAHTASYQIDTNRNFPAKNWTEHETVCSPPPSSILENAWNFTSAIPYSFMKWCLVRGKICVCLGVLHIYNNGASGKRMHIYLTAVLLG